MTKSLSFFATQRDLEDLLNGIETSRRIVYTLAGTFDEPRRISFDSHIRIDRLGVATKGDRNHERTYLVCNEHETVTIREVQQRNGSTRYTIDQLSNPAAVAFRPGGVFGKDYDCVIAGQVGTASTDRDSLELFSLFSREIGRQFEKVKSFRVGPEALEILARGGRLTSSIRSPREYDLTK